MNYPSLKTIPVEIPIALLDAVRFPGTIDMSLSLSEKKMMSKQRAAAVSRISEFLFDLQEIDAEKILWGRCFHAPTIAYLDRYYPGWRGYEVRYIDGSVG